MDSQTSTAGPNKAGQSGDSPVSDSLGAILRTKFDEAKAARSLYEVLWLECLRQYKGVYDPDMLKKMDANRSKAFVRLTRTKVKAMDSRLMDMMFPAGGDKNWAIAPVPVSPADEATIAQVAKQTIQSMAGQAKQELQAAAIQDQQNGITPGQPPAQPAAAPAQATAPPQDPAAAPPQAQAQPPQPQSMYAAVLAKLQEALPWLFSGDPSSLAAEVDAVADDALDKKFQEAKDRCGRMEKVVESQLDVSKYSAKCKAVIHSGNVYGTGVLKGPLVEIRSKGQWADSAGTGFAYQSQDDTKPYLEAVSIWDIYPDMNAMTLDEAEYVIQRHVMLKSDCRALAKRKDFRADVINEYLRENTTGDVETLSFESSIREINGKTNTTKTRGPRYEVLEYWGYVDGADLALYGVDVPEDQLDQEFEANVWTLGNQVIKAVLNPFDAGLRPYHFYYFEQDETSIFGIGIPEIMRDTQSVFNAAIRATVDNAAMSAGPMFEVNRDLLLPGEDVDAIIPFRVFERKGTGPDAQAASVRVLQIPNNTASLLALAQAFKQFGDESTTIPAYTQGEPTGGITKTVGGLSMLMGAQNITIKDTVRNFDGGITEPSIRGMYHWNMQFNQDTTIKGNFDISARGSASLVAKEVKAQQLETLAAQTANPVDQLLINRRNLMIARLRALDLNTDDLVYSEEEIAKQAQDRAANQPPDPGMLMAQLAQAKLHLDTLIREGQLSLEERKQALKEQEAAWAQKMEEAGTAVEQLRLQVAT